MQSLATQFSLDLSTLSRSITSLENKIKDPYASKVLKKVKGELKIQ